MHVLLLSSRWLFRLTKGEHPPGHYPFDLVFLPKRVLPKQ